MASAISKEIGKMIGFSRWPQRLKACPERSRRGEVNLIRSAARLNRLRKKSRWNRVWRWPSTGRA